MARSRRHVLHSSLASRDAEGRAQWLYLAPKVPAPHAGPLLPRPDRQGTRRAFTVEQDGWQCGQAGDRQWMRCELDRTRKSRRQGQQSRAPQKRPNCLGRSPLGPRPDPRATASTAPVCPTTHRASHSRFASSSISDAGDHGPKPHLLPLMIACAQLVGGATIPRTDYSRWSRP